MFYVSYLRIWWRYDIWMSEKKTMEQKMGTQPLSNIYSTLRVVTLDSILDRFFDLKLDRCYYLSAHWSWSCNYCNHILSTHTMPLNFKKSCPWHTWVIIEIPRESLFLSLALLLFPFQIFLQFWITRCFWEKILSFHQLFIIN